MPRKKQSEEVEEEFEVERVANHRFDSNDSLEYLIKWKGYEESENTWVPEPDVYAYDLVKAYWLASDEPPPAGTKAAKLLSSAKKEKEKASSSTATTPKNTQKRSASSAAIITSDDDEDDDDQVPSKTRKRKSSPETTLAAPSSGSAAPKDVFDAVAHGLDGDSWEDHIAYIDTMERKNNVLYVYFTLVSGKKACVPTTMAYKHFPMKMLYFYENHVRFRTS